MATEGKAGDGISDMIDFDVKCRRCGKPMTLRVRDEQARRLFLKEGAFCEACYGLGRRVGSAPAQAATQPAGSTNGRPTARLVSSLLKDLEPV
jgi:hypothetical protein